MIQVHEIELAALGVTFPTSLVRMVIMQPFLKLTAEPFRCDPARKEGQLLALERTLTIAQAAEDGAEKTHFTVFPEYSIPGLEGVERIENILRRPSWKAGTIVIGGTDALCKAEYTALCAENGRQTRPSNTPTQVGDGEWINCCITWVKVADNDVRRWLQPKIAPSWLEQNVSCNYMFRGDSVFLFQSAFANGLPCRFFSLICFDWTAAADGSGILKQVLDWINAQGQEASLSWVFVPQHNPEPCHTSFLNRAADFFQNQAEAPFVRRDRCCVVFANTAGKERPGRATEYGYTSLVFSPLSPFDMKGCHPTYSGRPKVLRGTDALDQCRDVVFRERGACIHSLSQHLPGAAILGAAGRSLPLMRARVYPLTDGLNDQRAPGKHVPACVKWVNDSLDEVPCLSKVIPGVPLATSVRVPHEENVAAFRIVESSHLEKDIDWATWRPPKRDPKDEDKPPTPDEWNDAHTAALRHVVHTLDILRIGGSQLDLASASAHASANLRGESIEVLAVNGPSHEACEEHARQRFAMPARRRVLLVTRDQDNAPRLKRDKPYVEPNSESRPGMEMKFTDVRTRLIRMAFHELRDFYIKAASAVGLEDSLYGRLTS